MIFLGHSTRIGAAKPVKHKDSWYWYIICSLTLRQKSISKTIVFWTNCLSSLSNINTSTFGPHKNETSYHGGHSTTATIMDFFIIWGNDHAHNTPQQYLMLWWGARSKFTIQPLLISITKLNRSSKTRWSVQTMCSSGFIQALLLINIKSHSLLPLIKIQTT